MLSFIALARYSDRYGGFFLPVDSAAFQSLAESITGLGSVQRNSVFKSLSELEFVSSLIFQLSSAEEESCLRSSVEGIFSREVIDVHLL